VALQLNTVKLILFIAINFHVYVLNYFSPLNLAFLLPEQYTGITDIDILFPLFLRRHSCEIKNL